MSNLTIAYWLSFLWRSWFWLGIWVFYYLRFTDYAGIGFLEAVMITTATIGEIPTGAIADLVGKKYAIVIAFLLGGLGNLVMAVAPNYWVLVASIVTMTLGGAFYSGSMEAMVYDSLKEAGQADKYQKAIGRMTTMQNLGMAVAGIVGGFAYQINVSLPFLFVAAAYMVGLGLSLGLKEPRVDTEKYSWHKFVRQNMAGFRQLFANRATSFMVMALLLPSAFMVATENVLNDATAVELGFNSIQLGIFATLLYLFGIMVSEKSDWLANKTSFRWLYAGTLLIYVLTLMAMPQAGFLLGALLLLVRYGSQTFFGNYESAQINQVVESRYRATTLSTFSLLRNIPYVLAATGIGLLMNVYTAKLFSMYFGIILCGALLILYGCKILIRKERAL